MVILLGLKGLAAGADPTSLGIMFGGIAAGYTGIMGAFVWGNVKVHEAAQNGNSSSTGGLSIPSR